MAEPDTTRRENEMDDSSEQILVAETKNTQVQVKTTETYCTLNLHFLIKLIIIILLVILWEMVEKGLNRVGSALQYRWG